MGIDYSNIVPFLIPLRMVLSVIIISQGFKYKSKLLFAAGVIILMSIGLDLTIDANHIPMSTKQWGLIFYLRIMLMTMGAIIISQGLKYKSKMLIAVGIIVLITEFFDFLLSLLMGVVSGIKW